MKIKKPIFIVGAGRSGTTILYNLLSVHPEICWFSNLTDRYPRLHKLAIIHRILAIPFLGNRMKKSIIKGSKFKFSIIPSEAGNIYHSFCRFEHAKKTTENDFREEMEDKFKATIKNHLRFTGKTFFLNKQTANVQRIRLINRMFPDAYYINIIRDGRAVAFSLLNMKWWNDVDIWWLGYKPSLWEELGREPIHLCALHWRREVQEILQNKYLFENRYFEIRYEELVKYTKDTINEIVDFIELNGSKKFNELIPESLPNMNFKWKKELAESQKAILNNTIGEFLNKLGYIV